MLSRKHTISHPAVAIPVVIAARGTAVETAIAGGKANIDWIIRNLRLIAIECTGNCSGTRKILGTVKKTMDTSVSLEAKHSFQESPPILKASIAINLKNDDNNVLYG
ncbi:hypothetical protein HZH66_003468 [Vespula vulgaris]|uniref:Uncharacterized protein n=1 Tax=Vespula vulgaris TaxID=7454 RepID=A0A834KER7_VESVU|nr:hypothetical protein HZH66_003468 [Vespula vulgaris]